MNDKIIMTKARELFLKDYKEKLKKCGMLSPSVNQNPIFPPWSNVEYSAMEEDESKYFLYFTAIKQMMQSFKNNKIESINILVLGAGRGRLVDYVKDCFESEQIYGFCHVIEVNKKSVHILQEHFQNDTNIEIHEPIVIRNVEEITKAINQNVLKSKKLISLVSTKSIDVIISELFGSFADNEFTTEILNAAKKLFGRKNQKNEITCSSLPKSYSCYVSLINSATLQTYFNANSCEKFYISGLPQDAVFLSDHVEICNKSCDAENRSYKASVVMKLRPINLNTDSDVTDVIPLKKCKKSLQLPKQENTFRPVTAIAGHFVAELFGDIKIDTRPCETRNTYFWESMLFPLNKETQHKANEYLRSHDCLSITISRHVVRLEMNALKLLEPSAHLHKMWYQWQLFEDDGKEYLGILHNENGHSHAIYL